MTSYLVTEWFDPISKAKGYVAFDTLVNGLAGGGIRMREGVTKEEVQRLAKIMTIKMNGLGIPLGGVKAGIDYPSNAPDSKAVLRRFLEAHKPLLLHMWATSEDLGTREEDIIEIVKEMGLHSTVDAFINKQSDKEEILFNLNTALNLKVDGIQITDLVTGYGVATTAIQGFKWIEEKETEMSVAIQGFGSVGASAAKYLAEYGAKVVAVADINGTIYNEHGLDIPLLLSIKDAKGNIDRSKLPESYEEKPNAFWMSKHVDILIPAAVADVITIDNASNVQARMIVEGANIPVTTEAEEYLSKKGIFVIPDFIANSGGAALFTSILFNRISPDATSIFSFLDQQLSKTIAQLLEIAKEKKITPREAAYLTLEKETSQVN
ncbi:Glu/Leu/Phe/Val dehydrogenase dimerization domain-containing protein [Bacillus sp. 165]|uniref:Glu/Leu/Phe/Val dehydrogenase dimerization domain-containing protein n=1 Tax=Bacillus sp. 165 TaxID=1529117 RepID=UPI001AD97AEF|nr:Glu/Leu/Phe/Val dehydrogenase dimerization domain-containing protein [Bacillus sp. 165]MBO9129269.1 hypothetical protein [Bacillus sp. 165]